MFEHFGLGLCRQIYYGETLATVEAHAKNLKEIRWYEIIPYAPVK